MPTKTLRQDKSKYLEIAVGLGGSTIFQVEVGEYRGFLIAEACSLDSSRDEIELSNVVYLRVGRNRFAADSFERVLIQFVANWWVAAEVGFGELFMYPSRNSYPMVHISRSEFEDLRRSILFGNPSRIIGSLDDKFEGEDFSTEEYLWEQLPRSLTEGVNRRS